MCPCLNCDSNAFNVWCMTDGMMIRELLSEQDLAG